MLKPPQRSDKASVAGRAGRFESLTLGLDGTNPRFPWKPSTTMLTYRLTGTTEYSGSTATNPTSIRRNAARPQAANGTESSRTMVRLEDGAALLTCGFGDVGKWAPTMCGDGLRT